ncbi:MAG: LysR family transcriptional regulator [Pseudomonadota bacterium]
MNLQLLDTFLDLMQTRSFNRSAERLGVTQSTVSHRVRSLETELGRRLFKRSRSGTEPTPAGLRFLEHAQALRQHWREAARHIGSSGAYDRTIRLGLQHDIADAFVAPTISGVRAQLPKMAVYLEVDYSVQMALDLLSGELDAALLFTPHYSADLHIQEIGFLRYVMVSTDGAILRTVDAKEYVFPNISPTFAQIHREHWPHLSDARLACGQSRAIRQILMATGGSSYVSLSTAEECVRAGELLPIADAPAIDQPVYYAVGVRNRHVGTHVKIRAVFEALFDQPENESHP